jgi:hypothetical protein
MDIPTRSLNDCVSAIISDLTDGKQKSFVNVLLKTLILTTKLKSEDLALWVDKELSGYDVADVADVAKDIIPNYRKLKVTVITSYFQCHK